MIEIFVKIIEKSCTLDVSLDSKCVFEMDLKTFTRGGDKDTSSMTEALLQFNMKMINRFFVQCLTQKNVLSLCFGHSF